MKAYSRPIILALAAVALAASLASLYVHYQVLRDPSYSGFCDISETVSCEAVYQSAYGTVYGVPVAAGGAIWSALVLLLAARGMGSPETERGSAAAGYVFVLSVLGLAAVFYYGYASFVVLQKMCVLCMTMYVAVVGIFIVSSSATSIAMASLPGRLLRDIRAVFMGPVAAGLAILWLVGSVSLIAFFPREGVQAAAQEVSAPLETLDAAQLAEWHSWLDKQPRVPEMLPTGNVKVVFIKFNDYQCPSCRMTWAAYRDVIAKWEADRPGVFSFQTRDFPLEVECGSGNAGHSGACESAVAVRLARARNHGPEMEAWLYEHQDELTRDRVKQKVREIAGVEDYDAQYPTVLAKVREDAQLGTRLGVTGTPTFFLNGIKMGNVRPAYLDAAIAYELQKAS